MQGIKNWDKRKKDFKLVVAVESTAGLNTCFIFLCLCYVNLQAAVRLCNSDSVTYILFFLKNLTLLLSGCFS